MTILILDDEKTELTKEHKQQIQEMIEGCEQKMITRFKRKPKVLVFISQGQLHCLDIEKSEEEEE